MAILRAVAVIAPAGTAWLSCGADIHPMACCCDAENWPRGETLLGAIVPLSHLHRAGQTDGGVRLPVAEVSAFDGTAAAVVPAGAGSVRHTGFGTAERADTTAS